jgi:lipoic acid synthetase
MGQEHFGDHYMRETGKPDWLKIKVQDGLQKRSVEGLIRRLSLHTVCNEAQCPNQMECFSRKTATFMILGRVCSRNCTFCNVAGGVPEAVDPREPERVAMAVQELGLAYAVITSVTRDDLPDGGAGHFAEVIRAVREINPKIKIEVLIPDFLGNSEALQQVAHAGPEVINHNVETVPRLYPEVRPQADYTRSLVLLEKIRKMDARLLTKSGIMVGLGEEKSEVIRVFKNLRSVGCDLLTVGQYLAPSRRHHPVVAYITPDGFEEYRKIALDLGFRHVASGPLVRSSYRAGEGVGESPGKMYGTSILTEKPLNPRILES